MSERTRVLIAAALLMMVTAAITAGIFRKKLHAGDPPIKSARLVYNDAMELYEAKWRPDVGANPTTITIQSYQGTLILERVNASGDRALYTWEWVANYHPAGATEVQ